MAYSLDLRKKVILHLESGCSQASAAKIFGIGERTIRRWVSRKQNTGSIERLPHGGGFPSKVNACEFNQFVLDHPDKTLKEMGEVFGISHQSAAYNLRKHGYVHKKKRFVTPKEKKNCAHNI
jgi:transposase